MKIQIAISLLLMSSVTHAGVYQFDPAQGRVSFLAKGRPAFISINGVGEGASGALVDGGGNLSGDLAFRMETLKTGIDLRDEHMKKKYLQVAQFPDAIFKINALNVPIGKKTTFSGTLIFHGIAHAIKGEVIASDEGKAKKISAEFPIRLSDFKIDIPNFQGITVAEDVQVKVETVVMRRE